MEELRRRPPEISDARRTVDRAMAQLGSQIVTVILVVLAASPMGCSKSLCVSGSDCEPCGFKCKKLGIPHFRSLAIPETYPLGSLVRAHYHTMETNGEAADFILFRYEFVGATAALTPNGKDHILEIAARMRSTPFPVLVERTENNSNPELDAHRRDVVAHILTDLGNPDAAERTFVSPAYGPGKTAIEAERDYYRYINGGYGGFNQYGSGFGQFGAFGGGVGRGIGFGP
jgi:hypothetical protein